MLTVLYQARLEDLREMASDIGLSKVGNVEQLRAALIKHNCLSGWDLSSEAIQNLSNTDLGSILATFGIKKSGSIKEKKQRLWLHLNKDPKQLSADMLDSLTRDQLHELCVHLSLPRSGSKSQLLGRVAGVLASQENGWGKVKKSLRRPRGRQRAAPTLPRPPSEQPTVATPIEPAPVVIDDEEIGPDDLLIESVLEIEPTVELPPLEPIPEPEPEFSAPMALPSTPLPAVLRDEMSSERQLALRTEVERFVSRHEGNWSFEEEAAFRAQLSASGMPIDDVRLSQTIADWMAAARDRWHVSDVDLTSELSGVADVGSEQGLLELEQRMPELDSALRDFLLISDAQDSEDVESFLDSLADTGIQVGLAPVKARVLARLAEITRLVEEERAAYHVGPGSWREREALRKFEKVRPRLVEGLETILEAAGEDHVQARMAFERLAREYDLDLRMASISGRLHGLFDLHVSLAAQAASVDPKAARRERLIKVLQHGAVHLSNSSQKTLDRLERNIAAFEQVVESILRKHEGEYGPGSQALLVRFLESRGYVVNTPELRPRVVACGGIVGVELGFLSPKDVPPLPTGVSLSETEIDAVVAELRTVVRQFKSVDAYDETEEAKEELQIGESVSDANDDLVRARSKMGHADSLLEKLRITVDEEDED
jgi:hypothetical protein